MSIPFGLATLTPQEAQGLIDDHPALAQFSKNHERPYVAAVAAPTASELDALSDVIATAREAFRTESAGAADVMRAILRPDQLTVGRGMMAQVRRDAQLRVAVSEEFGLFSAADVALNSGSRAENVNALASRWRKEGRIFAVPVDQALRFPGYQFDESGRPLEVVAHIVRTLADRLTPWQLALWFTADNSWLGGLRPADVLIGDPGAVRTAAQGLADELAPLAPPHSDEGATAADDD